LFFYNCIEDECVSRNFMVDGAVIKIDTSNFTLHI
jgi:hypothetical protein